MPFRHKKRHLKKRLNQDKKVVEKFEDNKDNPELLGNRIAASDCNVDKKSFRRKIHFLDIVDKVTSQLKSDNDNRFLKLLEDILMIYDQNSENETLVFQLLDMLFTYVLECDEGGLYGVKVNLSSKFLPKELKDLVVDADALEVTSYFSKEVEGFGFLKEGALKKPKHRSVPVLIKEPMAYEYNQHILSEAKILAQFDHGNVVKILAFQKNVSGPRFAIECMPLGNLEEALEKFDFSDEKLLRILKDVAEGMKYIAEKKYVHRELICTNVLLDSGGTCKISGFSLCRYVGDTGGVCKEDTEYVFDAPESRRTKRFTTKSDMWAMGLLSWDTLFSARSSWQRNEFISRKLVKFHMLDIFLSRGVLPNPGRCSPFLWGYIKNVLLHEDPEKRPTFAELRENLDKYNGILW